MADREYGFPICKNGRITKGKTVKGDSHSVAVPLVCPLGSKVIAIHHSHPGGSLQLSPQDIKTMHEKGLPVCIKAGNKVKCWRPKKA